MVNRENNIQTLEEAAENYRRKSYNAEMIPPLDGPTNEYGGSVKDAFIAGAEWMENQMPMPEDTVIFMKGIEEGRRLEREDRNDDKLPRLTKDYYYGG